MICDVAVGITLQHVKSDLYAFYVLLCQKYNQYQRIYPSNGCVLKNVIFEDDGDVFIHVVAIKPTDQEPVANQNIISKQITAQKNELSKFVDISKVQNEKQSIQINFLNDIIYLTVQKMTQANMSVSIDQISHLSDDAPCTFKESLFYRLCAQYDVNSNQYTFQNEQQLKYPDLPLKTNHKLQWPHLCQILFKGIELDLQQSQPLQIYTQALTQAIIKLREEAEPGECELRRIARVIVTYQLYGEEQEQNATQINIFISADALQRKIAQECARTKKNAVCISFHVDSQDYTLVADLYTILCNYQRLIGFKTPIQVVMFQTGSTEQTSINNSILNAIQQASQQIAQNTSNIITDDKNIQDLAKLVDVSNKFQDEIDQKIKQNNYYGYHVIFIPYIDIQSDLKNINDYNFDIRNQFYAIQKNQKFSSLLWYYRQSNDSEALSKLIDVIVAFINKSQSKAINKCSYMLQFDEQMTWQYYNMQLDYKKIKISELINKKKPKDPKEVILHGVVRICVINVYNKIVFVCYTKERPENMQLNNIICTQQLDNLTYKQLTSLQNSWLKTEQQQTEFRIKVYGDFGQISIRDSIGRQRQSKDVRHYVCLSNVGVKYSIMQGDNDDFTPRGDI